MEPILAAIQGADLIKVVVWILIAGLIFWLVTWLIDYCAVVEPFNKIAKVVAAIIAVIILINALLVLVGRPFITF